MLFCLLLSVTAVFARQISRQEAYEKAQQFMQDKNLLHSNSQSRGLSQLKRQDSQASQPFKNLYVFNAESNGGFVIVSADDRTQDILGYAEHGEFNVQTMPCQMQWLLNYYEAAIEQLGSDDALVTGHSATRSSQDWADISPIVDTQWGQGEPYNTLCPIHEGSRCVTGCVATAMAQVINYYRWPQAQTTSVPAYKTQSHNIMMQELPAKQFDWNNMNNTAIAQLMLYCGQSVHMDYDPAGSGAMTHEVPTALVNVFGFSKSASLAGRNSYSDEQWNQMVYDELRQRHPVLYFGQSPAAGGHAFIVDGYADGMYHLNWGWDGYCDGYFTLDRLNPNMDDGFNYNQEMIVNVCPPADASDISRPKAIVKEITYSERYLERSGSNTSFPAFTVTCTVESDLSTEATLQVGLALYDDNGLVKVLMQDTHNFMPNDSYTSEAQVIIDADLPQGEYRIVAISRGNDTEEWMANSGSTVRYVAVNVAETSIQLQPMPKSEEEQNIIEFGVHTIDGITYRLISEYGNLRAGVLLYNETEKYKGDIYIPNSVNYQNMVFNIIGAGYLSNGVFSDSPELTSLSIPIGIGIYSCPKLTNIEIREGVNYFPAIENCPQLKSITFPTSCNYIDINDIRFCENLTFIKFNNTHKITLRGNFERQSYLWSNEDLPSLTDVYFSGDLPPTFKSWPDKTINNPRFVINPNVKIHVPVGTMEVYQRKGWKGWNLIEDQPSKPIAVHWDYCGNDEIGTEGGIVVGRGDNDVEFAMRIPADQLVAYQNCRISAIEFHTGETTGNAPQYANVEYVFVTTPGTDYLAKQSVKTIRGTWTRVELSQPYAITGEELFVGIGRHHALEAFWANSDIAEDGLWCRAMGNDRRGNPGVWEKGCGISNWNHPLPIRAIIEGEKLPTDIVIASSELIDNNNMQQAKEKNINTAHTEVKVTNIQKDNRFFNYTIDNRGNYSVSQPTASIAQAPQKRASAAKQVRLKLRNRTPRLVKQITLDWNIDGNKQEPFIVETTLLPNHEDVVYINLPDNIAGRNHTVNFNVSDVDGETDVIQANSNVEAYYSTPTTTKFPRKIVMEEATGTWCGYCPAGIATIEKMNERYPDNFIAIAIHNDEMEPTDDNYYPFYSMVSGFPSARINRSYWCDLWSFDLDETKDQGEAIIKAEAEFTSDSYVAVNTETTFGFSDNGSTEYRIAYVVVEDNVGPYYQANYYSDPNAADDPNNLVNWWVHQDSYVEMTYNDVARTIYDYEGIAGLLPKEITEGETYKCQYTLTLPDNVQNVKNLKIVTLLIDTSTGEILNADRTTIAGDYDATAIQTIKAVKTDAPVYTLSGQQVSRDSLKSKKGIYIIGGRKVIVK